MLFLLSLCPITEEVEVFARLKSVVKNRGFRTLLGASRPFAQPPRGSSLQEPPRSNVSAWQGRVGSRSFVPCFSGQRVQKEEPTSHLDAKTRAELLRQTSVSACAAAPRCLRPRAEARVTEAVVLSREGMPQPGVLAPRAERAHGCAGLCLCRGTQLADRPAEAYPLLAPRRAAAQLVIIHLQLQTDTATRSSQQPMPLVTSEEALRLA